MITYLRGVLFPKSAQRIEDEIWFTIEQLGRQLADAEATGGQFMPAARSAREMLRAIGHR